MTFLHSLFISILSINQFLYLFIQLQFPYQERAADDAEKGLQDFIGELDPGIGRSAVHIGPAQGIACHHNDCAYQYCRSHAQKTVSLKAVMGHIGNRHGWSPWITRDTNMGRG